MFRRAPSISRFMALLVTIIVLSGLSIYGASILLHAGHAREQAFSETRRESSLVSATVGAIIGAQLGRLEAMAVIGAVPFHRPESISAVLEAASQNLRYIHSLRLLDGNGKVWLTVPSEPAYLGSDLSALPLVREALSTQARVWSPIHAGLDEGKRELSLALPSGSGLLLVVLDFESLADQLRATPSLGGTNLALTDSGGTYIIHPDTARVDRRETDALLVRERLTAPDKDIYDYIRRDDQGSWLVRAERVPGIGWFTIVQRSINFALATFASSVIPVSILALVALVVASGFAIFARTRLLGDVRLAGAYAESASGSGILPSLDSLYFRETRAIHEGIRAALQLLREKDAANERLDSLNRRLSETLEELSKAQTALVESEKLAILGRLAATLAHDLNTPIAAASVSSRTVLDAAVGILQETAGYKDFYGPEGMKAMEAIIQAVEAYDPGAVCIGTERRRIIGQGEAYFAAVDQTEAYGLATRLVDSGIQDPAAWEAIRGALASGGAAARAVWRALTMAEIIGASRIVLSATDTASSVVAALKAYVRGGLDTKLEAIDLVEEFNSLIALLGMKLRQSVNVRLDPLGHPLVYCHRESLKRVWMNLLLNAVEAMAYKGTLAIRISQCHTKAVVAIEDNGPGIPPDLLDSIWKPFFTTKADSLGTGLGLSIVKEILETEGGSVDVESRPGRTVFTVSLPLYSGGLSASAPGTPPDRLNPTPSGVPHHG